MTDDTLIPTTTRILPVAWEHGLRYGAFNHLTRDEEEAILAVFALIEEDELIEGVECIDMLRHTARVTADHDVHDTGYDAGRCRVAEYVFILGYADDDGSADDIVFEDDDHDYAIAA